MTESYVLIDDGNVPDDASVVTAVDLAPREPDDGSGSAGDQYRVDGDLE